MIKLFLTLLLFGTSPALFALTIAGVNVPDSAQVAGQSLRLNGAGTRLMAGIFKVYVVALYLPEPQHTPEAVFAEGQNKRLVLHLLFNVSTQQLLDATQQLLIENHSALEMKALSALWHTFAHLFKQRTEMNAGDEIVLDFVSNQGCQVSVNGQLVGQVSEQKFMRALLKVWLGEHPAQANLKQQLLGAEASNVAP